MADFDDRAHPELDDGLDRSWRVLLVGLALASAIGLVSTVLLRLSTTALGQPVPWSEAAGGWIDWYIWAAIAPLVVWLARAVPVRSIGWERATIVHAMLAAAVGLVELVLFSLAMSVYRGILLSQPMAPFTERYLFLIGRWLPVQMLTYALIVAVVTAIDAGRRMREREVRAARLETELSRAHLHALQAQIQPHFLFNVMNTVSMTVREGRDSDAVEMLAHLGGMLRRSIAASVEPDTSLEKELEFLRHYLRLESCRMEERLEVRWEVDPAVLDASIPSMLLQPIVENAVRHGLAESVRGGTLTLRTAATGDDLTLVVSDDGMGIDPGASEGTGLRNVRRRLETRYGDRAQLRVEPRESGGTTATITLPRTRHEPTSADDTSAARRR